MVRLCQYRGMGRWPPLRVVIDTNVLAAGSFELLEANPFRKLCETRRIIPIYGHVFLEETFPAYGSESKREHLVQQWIPLIVATVDRFCDDFLGIWHKELVQGRGRKTNIYMRKRDQETFISRLQNIPLDGSWRAMAFVQAPTQRRGRKEGSAACRVKRGTAGSRGLAEDGEVQPQASLRQ